MQSGSTEPVNPCLNCRQRNKRCDGEEPVCNTCIRSGLFCQGYDVSSQNPTVPPVLPLETCFSCSPSTNGFNQAMQDMLSNIISNPVWLREGPQPHEPLYYHKLDNSDSASTRDEEALSLARLHFTGTPGVIPSVNHGSQAVPVPAVGRSLALNPQLISNTLPFIISQYVRLVNLIAFRSPPIYLQAGLNMRVKASNIVHSSMFLGAKIIQALLDNFDRADWRGFTRRIDQLYRQIDLSPNSNSSILDLESRLTGVMDLAGFKFITADTPSGYLLMKHAAPLFHRVACCYPTIWTNSGSISLPRVINLPNPEIFRFVWMDTISALIFGTNPLLLYDSHLERVRFSQRQLEWMYGCPEEFVVLLGQLNAGRSYRVGHNVFPSNSWSSLEVEIRGWVSPIEQSLESCTSVARLAVHECWRHTLLIYLYMGVYGVNSVDPRVDLSVRQVIQLLSTVKNEASIDRHLFVPCLVAGICARKEMQRALVRRRVASLSATKIWVIQGADFTLVLDYLWHGAAKNGRPVTWNDYVASRRAVLPIDE